jgi:mannose-6-phosphate isomerase-like protein (cupin superfamily)
MKSEVEGETNMQTKQLPEEYDYLAPDGTEIRLLLNMKGGGLAHCTLPPKGISLAVKHKTVDEIWYFIEGQGKMWRKQETREETTKVSPGTCITIPVGTKFQIKNTGEKPLCFIISTMPPWPGEDEAIYVQDHWEVK